MNLRSLWTFVFFILFASSVCAEENWRKLRIWDDSNAEYSVYEARWFRYGNLFSGAATMILVKEPWAPDLNVKADRPRPDGFDVLKFNFLRDVQTGIYTYHQMVSAYLRRDNAEIVKLTATSSEACGISTAHLKDGELLTESYFDGEGSQSTAFPKSSIAGDTLPAVLRDYIHEKPPAFMNVFPSLLTNRYQNLKSQRFRVHKKEAVKVSVPAGDFSATKFHLKHENLHRTYWFDSKAPHVLLKFDQEDGTQYKLIKSERIQYWKLNRPGDESFLEKSLSKK